MSLYGPFARYYDADVSYYTEDVPLYREMVRRTGGPILELMCGTGRLLVPLAEDGHMLTGVDVSGTMLEIARAKLARIKREHQVTLVQNDVRTMDLPQQHFALIFVGINSFMHLEHVEDQLATLTRVRQALKPNGLFIIDLLNPDPEYLAQEDNRLILERNYTLDGQKVYKFVASESDMGLQVSYMTYMYDEIDSEGRVTRRVMRFNMRWFYRYEIEHLLARAGFELEAIYGSYDLQHYMGNSQRMIVVAS